MSDKRSLLPKKKMPEGREAPKISFSLDPHPETKWPPLPGKNNRLTCNRMLRLKKLVLYVQERIPETRSVRLQILLDNQALGPNVSLAVAKYCFCKTPSSFALYYK
jgi:hypothetical protein